MADDKNNPDEIIRPRRVRPEGAADRPRRVRPEGAEGRPRRVSTDGADRPRRVRPEGAEGRPRRVSAGGEDRPRRVRPEGPSDRPRRASTAGDGVARRRPESEGGRRPDSEARRRREAARIKAEQERKKKNRNIIIAVVAALLVVVVVGFALKGRGGNGGDTPGTTPGVTQSAVVPQATNTPAPTDTPAPTPTPEPKYVNLCAVGDDLVHTGVYKAGHQADGSHDYTCLFKNVTYLMTDCDIKAINQETIFAGDDKGLQSYPLFNSPVGIADAIVKSGFNLVSHATNHAFDQGLDGLLYSVSYWKASHPETFVIGIYENAEAQAEIPIMEVNGIKFAMLNYTYSHNWETFSSSAEGHLNMLCAYDKDSRKIDFNTINPKVIEDIKKAEELADFTIIFPHWGTEYVLGKTDQQINFAKQMTEAGADLIIGTHPHVIEPVEWVTAENGNKSLCYYSLGNFTSTQDEFERILGGMAKLQIVKDGEGTHIVEDSVKAIPLVTHYVYPGWTGGTVVTTTYSLANYTEELAAAHGLLNRCGIKVKRDGLVKLSNEVFGDFCSIE